MNRKPRYDPEDPIVVIKVMTDIFTFLAVVMGILWLSGFSIAGLVSLFALPIAMLGNLILRGPKLLRWVLAQRAKNRPLASDELFLGRSFEWPHDPVRMNDDEREGHMAILGRMGSGKSSQIKYMAMQDILQGRPIILMDPHVSLAEETTELCCRYNRVPVLLQPDPRWMSTLNLLETGPGYTPMDAARTVIEGFTQVYLPYQHEVPMRIRHLVTVAAYMLAASEEGYTMLEMTRWMMQRGFRDYLARKTFQNTRHRHWLESSQELSSLQWLNGLTRMQQYDHFQSTWTRISGLLSHPDAQRLLGCSQSTFNFKDIRAGTPLLIGIGEETLHRTGHLLNALIITWITKRLLGSTRDPSLAVPLSLYVDELADISPESFERLLRHARKRSVRLTVAVQAQTMLHRKLYATLMGNVSNLIIFGSSGPGVEELTQEVSRPDEAERRAGSASHFMELARQLNATASLIRDLPNHEFLLWQSTRSGPPRHCVGGLVAQTGSAEIQQARSIALKRNGRATESIDKEIRQRTAEMDARFGPLHEFGVYDLHGVIAPW